MRVTKKQLQDKLFETMKERNQFLDESNRYLQALHFMASQLTNPDNPPSIKIALALEEYISAVQKERKI